MNTLRLKEETILAENWVLTRPVSYQDILGPSAVDSLPAPDESEILAVPQELSFLAPHSDSHQVGYHLVRPEKRKQSSISKLNLCNKIHVKVLA